MLVPHQELPAAAAAVVADAVQPMEGETDREFTQSSHACAVFY